MGIRNPIELVDEFKKSGEFDRLRRELLAEFKHGDSINSFLNRIEDITREKLKSDTRLRPLNLDARHTELLQELDRYPIVERAVSEVPAFPDPSFSANIRKTLTKILEDDRNGISVKEAGEGTTPSSFSKEDSRNNLNGTNDTVPAGGRASSLSPSTGQPFADNKMAQNVILDHDMTGRPARINGALDTANGSSSNSPIQFHPAEYKDD